MKNIKKILGIALVAAIISIFSACGLDEEEPEPVYYTVTYNGNGGTGGVTGTTGISSVQVPENDPATEPATTNRPTYYFDDWVPTTPGLYKKTAEIIPFSNWVDESGNTFSFTTPITRNTTLKATWVFPYPESINAASDGSDIVEKAIDKISSVPGTSAAVNKYYLFLTGANASVPITFDTEYTELTIIGIVAGSSITYPTTSTGVLLTVGKVDSQNIGTANAAASKAIRKSIKLTLGNNITLQGKAGNNAPVLRVQNDASLVMLSGSKVAGNEATIAYTGGNTNGFADYYGNGAAVHVGGATDTTVGTNQMSGAYFTMKGGEISGNKSLNTNATNTFIGGLYGSDGSRISLEGGRIIGNTSTGIQQNAYVVQNVNIILKGGIEITDITLNQTAAGVAGNIILDNYTGGATPTIINLRADKLTAAEVATAWTGKPVLVGFGSLDTDTDMVTPVLPTADDVAKFTLFRFLDNTIGYASIDATHKISDTGNDIGKLVAK